MKNLIGIIVSVAVILCFFYVLRFLYKRITLLIKLKRISVKKHIKIIKTHSFWYLGSINKNKCDFYILTPYKLFSVCLWSTPWKNCDLYIDKNRYYYKYFIVLFGKLGEFLKLQFKSAPKKALFCDHNYKYDCMWYGKEQINVILLHPVCNDIQIRTNNEWKIIGNGDKLPQYNSYIYSLQGLIRELDGEQTYND